jgi:hypothetical protein
VGTAFETLELDPFLGRVRASTDGPDVDAWSVDRDRGDTRDG